MVTGCVQFNQLPYSVFIVDCSNYIIIFQNDYAKSEFGKDGDLINESIFTLTNHSETSQLLELLNTLPNNQNDRKLIQIERPHFGNTHCDLHICRTTISKKDVWLITLITRWEFGIENETGNNQIESEILNTQNELICRFLPDTSLIYVNKALCEVLNKTHKELIGSKLLNFLNNAEKKTLLQEINYFKPDRIFNTHIHVIDNRDKKKRWIEWQQQAFYSSDQKLIYIQSIGRDISDRKELDLMLKKSIAPSDYILNLEPDWFFRIDRKGKILAVNPVAKERPSFVDDLNVGNTLQSHLTQELADIFNEKLHAAISQKIAVKFESPKFENQAKSLEWQILPLRKKEAFVMVQDIDEKKRSEQDFFQNQQAIETFLRNAPIGIAAVNSKGKYILVNTKAEEMFGYSSRELINLNIVDICHKDHLNYGLSQFNILLETGRAVFDILLERKDGSNFWCAHFSMQLNVDLFVAFMIDIDERVRMRAEIAKEKAILAGILNSIPDIIFYKDTEGKYVGANPAFCELLGLKEHEIIGKKNHDLFDKKNADWFTLKDNDLYISKKSQVFEERAPRLDGTSFPVETLKAPLYDLDGKLIGLVGHSRNIEKRKEQEKDILLKSMFQYILIRMANQLINAPLEKLDEVINSTLGEAGQFFQVDRAYVFDYNFEANTINNSFEWCNYGVAPGIDLLQNTALDDFGDWVDPHKNGEPLIIEDVYLLPEADKLRKVLELQEIRTLIAVPLYVEDDLIGFVGFDAVKEIKTWTESEMLLLKFYAELLANVERRKRYEASIYENEQLLNLATKGSGTVIWDWDLDKKQLRFSSLIQDITGNKDFPLIVGSQDYLAFVHPDDQHQLSNQLQACEARITNNFQAEYRIKHALGHYCWLYDAGSASEFDKNKRTIRISGTITNISRQKELEIRIKESEQQFRLLADNLNDVIWLCNADENNVSYVNNAYEQVFQESKDPVLGNCKGIFSNIFDEDQNEFFKKLEKFHKEENYLETSFRIKTIQNELKWINIKVSKIGTEIGKSSAHVGIASDITKIKQEEDRLTRTLILERQLNELKTVFIQKASHEFRTPLSSIMATSETIKSYRTKMTSEEVNQRLDKIIGQVNHLKRILEDLLSFTRIKDNIKSFKPQVDNIVEYTKHIAGIISTLPSFEHQLIYDLPDYPIEVEFDNTLMQRALTNALENAAKYSDSSKPIILKLVDHHEKIEISITDSGIGVPENELNKLFEPFFRASNSIGIPGTGLGLPILIESIELHQGKVKLESKENVGTTITMILPKIRKNIIKDSIS